ncbi:tetratricopeptide repeat-containing protein [Streptomyces solincola]|uniref:Tetratricopeptide repeat-containing protein n=1 Tax=Streptomyces solincola TaxID=2100817 RepID=A0A2S9Q1R7_9ACTN|nr:FxSxx-COOH system tetratricopeptide repeat protein [Streptomyces solincola]PRH80614.1 tetratricopeptide repeat-containing protein [Streptomyces solincola]
MHASQRAPAPAAPVRGREPELGTLDALVRTGGMAVVCGAGGLGKTTLATEAASRAAAEGRAVFFVRWRDDAARLAGELTRIAQALGLTDARLDAARTGRAALVDTVWEHLSAVRGWVIVVDNVDTPERVGPAGEPIAGYRGWLRPDGPGLLLITSRDTSAATWGPRATLLHLGPLDDQAAGAVLRDAAPEAGTEEEAAALGARLGGLPLALEAAGRYLASPTSRFRHFTDYREALGREFGDLLGAEHPRAAADPVLARSVVRHTWHLSLDQLAADGIALARPLLRLLALLEAAPVPRTLVTPALVSDACGLPATAAEVDAALAGLHRYGLLGSPQGVRGEPSQVALHPLVREVAALGPDSGSGSDSDSDSGSDPGSGSWYDAIDHHLDQAVADTAAAGRAGWPVARLLAPHLPASLERASDDDFPAARDSLDTLAGTLHAAGATTEEVLLRGHVLEAENDRFGPDHPHTLTSRLRLAVGLRALGEHRQAADLQRRTLATQEHTLGPDHPDTLTCRNELAVTLRTLGDLAESADLHRQVLTTREHTLGPDHTLTLTSRNNLATALHGLGYFQQAADLHRQTLTAREDAFGPDHPRTLASRNNLAAALNSLGRWQQAADLHRQTLAGCENTFGPDYPGTLTSRHNLADSLRGLGRHAEAADLHRRNVTARVRLLGAEHRYTCESRANLALALTALGHHREAVGLHRQNLAAFERALGPDHPDTEAARARLAAAEAGPGRRRPWRRRRAPVQPPQ